MIDGQMHGYGMDLQSTGDAPDKLHVTGNSSGDRAGASPTNAAPPGCVSKDPALASPAVAALTNVEMFIGITDQTEALEMPFEQPPPVMTLEERVRFNLDRASRPAMSDDDWKMVCNIGIAIGLLLVVVGLLM